MGTFDIEKGMYIAPPSSPEELKEYLLEYGVDSRHIDKMQRKLLQRSRSAYQEYEGDSEVRLVPLKKVIGADRGTVGLSVFENVRIMHQGVNDPNRYPDCFTFFSKYPLEELKKTYEKLKNPVIMDYYADDDEYFVTGDGNHRTLVAMLVGAENIIAMVNTAKCNQKIKEEYFRAREIKQNYNIVRIKDTSYHHIVSNKDTGGSAAITFRDEKGLYEINFYPGKSESENIYEFLERLSKVIDEDIRQINHLQQMPKIIREILLKTKYKDNIRLEFYLNIVYFSDDPLGYRGIDYPERKRLT